ncbi:MAG: MBL fold metallo-hydrolase [Verrucomicrobiales bacterium]
MEYIHLLGTGSGIPVGNRLPTASLCQTQAEQILVDAGEGCTYRLLHLGYQPADIDVVFITHAHSDHIAGLPLFLQSCWLAKRTKPLRVVMPQEIIHRFQAWLATVYLGETLFDFAIHWEDWESQPQLSLAGDWQVSRYPTTHLDSLCQKLAPNEASRFRAYSLLFEHSTEGTFAFSGDIGRADEVAPLIEKPLKFFLCELSHFHPPDLMTALSEAHIQQLVITHLFPGLDEAPYSWLIEFQAGLKNTQSVKLAEDKLKLTF